MVDTDRQISVFKGCFSNLLALIWRVTRALFAVSRFLSRNSLVFEISRYLAKKLENRTNIDRLIYIKDPINPLTLRGHNQLNNLT